MMRPMCGMMVAVAASTLVACGGGTRTTQEDPRARPAEQREGRPCCVSERWAQPPREIGETPPPRDAPSGAADAFVRPDEPSDDDD
jgi:hypothetical protein